VFRKLMFFIAPIAIVLGLLFGMQTALGLRIGQPTVGNANACLPCYCPHDARINCLGNEYYGVYTRTTSNGACYIDVVLIDPDTGRGRRGIRVTPREQAAVEEFPTENTLVDSYYEASIYRLTSGEWQVNAGPNVEGKVYVVTFTGCPATNVHEYDFVVETPTP
jgi:hypothetical protein